MTRPFVQVSEGLTLDEVTRGILGLSVGHVDNWPPPAGGQSRVSVTRQIAAYRRKESQGLLQRFFNHVERERRVEPGGEQVSGETVRIITAGPNAFVYFLDTPEPLLLEDIERRHPGAAVLLSEHPGIGLVLARSAAGPVCWWRGRMVSLEDGGSGGPFAAREDREIVLAGLRDLMAMPSAGDLVVYGIGAPESDVSFIEERGAHAGPSEHEMHTFLIYPARVSLPGPLSPVELYAHFAAYHRNVR